MPVTLTIPLLQEHNVCSSGQVSFRRKFGRTHTWDTVERFANDMRVHCGEWDWAEAVDKFGINSDDHETKVSELSRRPIQGDLDSDDEDDWDAPSDTESRAMAWAHLYWEKMNASSSARLPQIAREYLQAVDRLEEARKFKARTGAGTVTLRMDFESPHRMHSGSVVTYMRDRVLETLPAFVDNAIAHYEAEVEARRVRLTEVAAPVAEEAPIPKTLTYTAATLPHPLPFGVAIRLSDLRSCDIQGVGTVDADGNLIRFPLPMSINEVRGIKSKKLRHSTSPE